MSSMADLASALQSGGGPPGPGPGAGPDPGAGPPDLGGAGGGLGPDPYNLDQGPPPPDQGAGDGTDMSQLFSNSMEALDVAEEAIHAFIRMDPDHGDRATAAQALNVILKLKASNQQSNQAGDAKSLSRALQSAGPPPGAGGGPPGLGG